MGSGTVRKWECQWDFQHNHVSIPRIIRFLGNNPLPAPSSPEEEVRQARLTLGLTQKEFAKRLGVSQQIVYQWERGEREPLGTIALLVSLFLPLGSPACRVS